MSLPFSSGRDDSKGSGEPDPFLEFRSELDRAAANIRRDSGKKEPRSAINAPFAFALGVAGVAMAAVAYYQLAHVLATRQGPATAAILESLRFGSPTPTPSPTKPTVSRSAPASSAGGPAKAGAGASIVPSAEASGPPGWVMLDAHVDLQVFEGKQRLGTSKNSRLELPPGVHTLTLVNNDCEIRQTMSVTVASNKTSQLPVNLPSGTISLSALPWAQTWIDGVPVGTTPLANLSVPVGVHEIVWQHPTLGERRQSVTVKAKTPLRIGVDYLK